MTDTPIHEPDEQYELLADLTDHEYDGILEYDNPVPAWWHWLFFGSFVFSIFYLMYYMSGVPGRTLAENHATAVAQAQETLLADLGMLQPDQKTILEYMDSKEWMAYAGSVFAGNCAQCHGANAEGQVGPNLTDDAYINVKQITDIATVISNGANNQAMPAWGQQFHPTQITLLSSYVATLRGQNIPGKSAEGEVIPPWPTPEVE